MSIPYECANNAEIRRWPGRWKRVGNRIRLDDGRVVRIEEIADVLMGGSRIKCSDGVVLFTPRETNLIVASLGPDENNT